MHLRVREMSSRTRSFKPLDFGHPMRLRCDHQSSSTFQVHSILIAQLCKIYKGIWIWFINASLWTCIAQKYSISYLHLCVLGFSHISLHFTDMSSFWFWLELCRADASKGMLGVMQIGPWKNVIRALLHLCSRVLSCSISVGAIDADNTLNIVKLCWTRHVGLLCLLQVSRTGNSLYTTFTTYKITLGSRYSCKVLLFCWPLAFCEVKLQ